MAAERTRWRAISARRVAAFFGRAEEQPVASGTARTVDVAIAVVATIAAVVAVIVQARTRSGPYGIIIARPGTNPVFVPQHWLTGWPSAWILLGAAMTTAPLAFRRIYPITTFGVIMVAVFATSGYSTSITFVAVIFAAYSAVAYSPFRRAALLGVLVAAVIVTAAYPDTSPPVPARFGAMLVLVPTVAVAVAIRVWRRRAAESAERLRRAQAEHEAETQRAVALERVRIASEMHDVVTHNVSVMVVQAGAARRVLESSPGEAREALLAVEASGRTAMTELRHLLGLLAPAGEAEPGATDGVDGAGAPVPGGADDATLTPQPGVARIPALLARVGETGMPAELSVEAPGGTAPDLPPGIDLAAYRVVQEGLTNVMKHAGLARTTVRLQYRPRDLVITVSDDGRPLDSGPAPAIGTTPGPGPGSGPGGRGLIGLRERIAVYGGELDAGPRPGGGWRLTARIPLEPASAADSGPDQDLPAPPEFQDAST